MRGTAWTCGAPRRARARGRPTSISSMVCTMNMSCRSSMALSIQLLKGAARLAYSRCSWSMVSSCFSVFCGVRERGGDRAGRQVRGEWEEWRGTKGS